MGETGTGEGGRKEPKAGLLAFAVPAALIGLGFAACVVAMGLLYLR